MNRSVPLPACCAACDQPFDIARARVVTTEEGRLRYVDIGCADRIAATARAGLKIGREKLYAMAYRKKE